MSYVRKTRDEWRLWADYGYGNGWELETTEETYSAIRELRKEYRENAPQYTYKLTGPHRVAVEKSGA